MLLAIDTSGKQTYVALALGSGKIAATDESADIQSHSSSLSSLVNGLLKANKVSALEITAIALGAGPGSFTGLRIGFAFAKGLAVAANIPIIKIGSLNAAAWQFRAHAPKLLAIDDARRDQFFAAPFACRNQSLTQEMEARIISHDDVLNWRKQNSDGLLVSANESLSKIFSGLFHASNIASSLIEQAGCAEGIRGLDTIYPANFKNIAELAELTPLYIREVAAMTIEERRKQGV